MPFTSNHVEETSLVMPLRDITNQLQNKNCQDCQKGKNSIIQSHICQHKVHCHTSCSLEFPSDCDNTAYQQLRICIACSKKPDIDNIIAANEIENHMGHAIKDIVNPKPVLYKNLYLSGSRGKIRDVLTYGQSSNTFKSIPIIKRG